MAWQDNKAYWDSNMRPPVDRPLNGISRVGFDEDKKKALFCITSSGANFLMTSIFYLEKQSAKWVLIEIRKIGIS
jgi:hypothetical protein